jgi:hypothetical protein
MTAVRAQIIAAIIAAVAGIIVALIALHGSSGSGNNCPADHSSTTNCSING